MLNNEYYILAIGQLNLLENSEIVESLETVRYNLAGNKFVCKTKRGIVNPPFMNPNIALTHDEVIIEMRKSTWTPTEDEG
jgi:hypothetical protein